MIKSKPARLFFRIIASLRLADLMRYLNRKKTVILMYHNFVREPFPNDVPFNRGLRMGIEKFRSQLEYAKKHYNIIPLERLVRYYKEGVSIPENPMVITIDDGYKLNYTLAYPVLRELDVPATIFVTTDFIDKKEPLWMDRVEYAIFETKLKKVALTIGKESLLFEIVDCASKKIGYKEIASRLTNIDIRQREEIITELESSLGEKLVLDDSAPEAYQPLEWREISEMASSRLVSIGGHTCSHTALAMISPEEIVKELADSKAVIEEKASVKCDVFSYPNGERSDFDEDSKGILKRCGYICALTTISGMNGGHFRDLFELKRFNVDAASDMNAFVMTVSGIMPFLVHMKLAVFGVRSRRRK